MSIVISAASALWFLPFAIVISIWVAYTDLKFMKITNKAVFALIVVFLIIGFLTLPFEEYTWRMLHFVVMLVIGFLCSSLGFLGAGDAKFAAAIAPFVAWGDAAIMMYILAAVVLVSLLTHRLFQRSKAFRKLTSDWKSWDNKDFPMGVALGASLVVYLALGVAYGQ
ncbi:membrane protein [Marinosulfonomonas sp. PRT-SC04]|nr:membrane protein [Marinosulfonomonas sp. PRT-SC04]